MDFLLFWTTWEQIIFVLVVFSTISVSGLYLVRILVPLEAAQAESRSGRSHLRCDRRILRLAVGLCDCGGVAAV